MMSEALLNHDHPDNAAVEACWECITESLLHELDGAASWVRRVKAGEALPADIWQHLNDFRDGIGETLCIVLEHPAWGDGSLGFRPEDHRGQ
jgi:hypothetical protein